MFKCITDVPFVCACLFLYMSLYYTPWHHFMQNVSGLDLEVLKICPSVCFYTLFFSSSFTPPVTSMLSPSFVALIESVASNNLSTLQLNSNQFLQIFINTLITFWSVRVMMVKRFFFPSIFGLSLLNNNSCLWLSVREQEQIATWWQLMILLSSLSCLPDLIVCCERKGVSLPQQPRSEETRSNLLANRTSLAHHPLSYGPWGESALTNQVLLKTHGWLRPSTLCGLEKGW